MILIFGVIVFFLVLSLLWRFFDRSQTFPNDFHPKELTICTLPSSSKCTSRASVLSVFPWFCILINSLLVYWFFLLFFYVVEVHESENFEFWWCQYLIEIPNLSRLERLTRFFFSCVEWVFGFCCVEFGLPSLLCVIIAFVDFRINLLKKKPLFFTSICQKLM